MTIAHAPPGPRAAGAARRRSTVFLLPVALLAAAAALVGAYWAVQRIDRIALEFQQSQVLATVDEYRDRLSAAAAAELQWDEAVRKLDHAFDPAWADSNLGAWLGSSQGIEQVLVFDRADWPIHASMDGERVDPREAAALCRDGGLLRRLRERELARGPLSAPAPDFDRLISTSIAEVAFGRCDGQPVVVVAILVQPDFGRSMPLAARAPVVLLRKRLDDAMAARIARALQLGGMRFEPAGTQARDAVAVALAAPDGTEVARLAWQPKQPGRALVAEAAPFAAVGLGGLLLLAVLATRRLRRAQDLVREAAARAERHADSLERMSSLSRIGAWAVAEGDAQVELSRESARILGFDTPGTRPLAEMLAHLAPEAGGRVERALGDCLRFGEPFELLAETAGTDGAQRTLRLRGRAATGDGGRTIEATLQDITEQVEQQQAQRRDTELLARMSRLAHIGGWEYDVRKRVLTLTEQSYRIYGFTQGTAVTLDDIIALYEPRDAAVITDTVARASREGAAWELELSPTTADGRRVWVRGRGESEVADGRLLRLFGTLQDTTEARLAEMKLRDAVQRAAERNAEIEQFTFAASHDLQEPVRKVQALGSLLLIRHAGQLDDAGRDCVQRMQRSCERMSVLVDDVLSYSRLAMRPALSQPVDLQATVAAVREDLDGLIAASRGRLLAGDLPVVTGDPLQIRRMVQNLLANAFRYRHPERAPTVRIFAMRHHPSPEGACWRLVVEDDGVGFDPRHAEAIFLPFVRLQRDDGNGAGSGDGSGIGLAIVRRIAQAHGGRVFAEGRPGLGARFVVELPARPTDAASSASPSAA